MTGPNTSDTNTTQDPAAQLAEQQRADVEARAEAERLAAEDRARDDAEAAREAADRAVATADTLAERAETIADDTEETETIALRGSMSVRLPGGGTRTYGPGSAVKVPKFVADIVRAAPSFARSGRAGVDRAVRRVQERHFGIQEVATTEDTTGRTVAGEANAVGGEDEHEDEGLPPTELATAGGGAKGSRARYTEQQKETEAALNEQSADEVEAKYKRAVKAGKVRPIRDGQGSGANGNVVKADHVAALVTAKE